MIKNILQSIADFLEFISRAIEPKVSESTFEAMDRKELIEALQQHQLQVRELKQTNKDFILLG